MSQLKRSEILEVLHTSLQGLMVDIIEHQDPGIEGLSGIIVDESRHMLSIRLPSKDTTIEVEKKSGTYILNNGRGGFKIDGRMLEGRAKRRIKRKLRHW